MGDQLGDLSRIADVGPHGERSASAVANLADHGLGGGRLLPVIHANRCAAVRQPECDGPAEAP